MILHQRNWQMKLASYTSVQEHVDMRDSPKPVLAVRDLTNVRCYLYT